MTSYREILANFDRDTIVVYQAYRPQIADAALAAGRFVEPFSFGRMTWIKPSFLWLMERSNWGRKSGQERVLGVRIRRSGWDKALSLGVLTSFESSVHGRFDQWQKQFESAMVHVQWDPERSIHGKKLEHRSIQIGVGRHVIREFVEQWIIELADLTPLVQRIRRLCEEGRHQRAKELLPVEKKYSVEQVAARRLGMNAE